MDQQGIVVLLVLIPHSLESQDIGCSIVSLQKVGAIV